MALDTDVVLWALRGLHDPKRGGVGADHVARFMAKDATLSENYSSDDVTEVLESLVAEGTLTHASNQAPVLYRFASVPESMFVPADDAAANSAAPEDWDDWLRLGAGPLPDLALEVLPDVALLLRVDELEQERDELSAERETWRRRAESAEQEVALARDEAAQGVARAQDDAEQAVARAQDDAEQAIARARDEAAQKAARAREVAAQEASRARDDAEQKVSRARGESAELRERIRTLENLLERERALAAERSAAASRIAEALTRAGKDLERLEQPKATRDRKPLRGNWLE